MGKVEIDKTLYDEATKLDQSSLNRSNIQFSWLSMKIAKSLLTNDNITLEDLSAYFIELATAWNTTSTTAETTKPPFCCVEGVAYAVNAIKMKSIKQSGLIRIIVPFYCEFERGRKATPDNPNGEESPIQKVQECMFLLDMNPNIKIDLIFVNDSIAEKKDEKDGGSAKLFHDSIVEYIKEATLNADVKDDSINLERLSISFQSCELEASKDTPYESAQEKRTRLENRDPKTNKLQERKGGAVLAGMEIPLSTAEDPQRVIRCLVDGDSAHPVASFVGDAAYAILELGNTAYLGNMKNPCTCISVAPEEEGSGGGESAGTRAKVKNRKLFFSGFIVPFLFPELSVKYKYTGTTQLPIKAFRGDIDFCKAKLPTVQPNVDLGMLALLVSQLNEQGGTIDSGAVTIRDNVASSTMTTTDLDAEWTKTYGPIFTSAVGLCRNLKPKEFQELDSEVTKLIETMQLKDYELLFAEDAMSNPDIKSLFEKMEKYKGASDRAAVLSDIKPSLVKLFAA